MQRVVNRRSVLGGFARNILRGRVSRKGAKNAKEGEIPKSSRREGDIETTGKNSYVIIVRRIIASITSCRKSVHTNRTVSK